MAEHRCQSCGHDGPTRRRHIDAPTGALREVARQSGVGDMWLWLCDDAQACLQRSVARTRGDAPQPGG